MGVLTKDDLVVPQDGMLATSFSMFIKTILYLLQSFYYCQLLCLKIRTTYFTVSTKLGFPCFQNLGFSIVFKRFSDNSKFSAGFMKLTFQSGY